MTSLAARAVVLTCCIASTHHGLQAQEVSSNRVTSILVWHRSSNAVEVKPGTRDRAALGPDEYFWVRKRSIPTIKIVDYNPLLFTYQVSRKDDGPTQNEQAAASFAGTLVKLGALLGGGQAAPAGADSIETIESLVIADITAALTRLDEAAAQMRSLIDESLSAGGGTIEQAEVQAAALRMKVAGWSSVADAVRTGYKALDFINSKCARDRTAALSTNIGTLFCNSDTITPITAPLNDHAAEAIRLVGLIESFAVDVASAGPFTIAAAPFSANNTSLIIDIKPNTKYRAFLSPNAAAKQRQFTATVALPLRPYSRLEYSVAPAVVFAFIENPEFSTTFRDGKFHVEKRDTELTQYSAAAMFNIAPTRWKDESFAPLFQFGVSPTKDQVGFFFGAAAVFADKFAFGGGVMRRQVRRRSDALGDVLDTPDQLQVVSLYKNALYLTFTYTPK